MLIPKLVQGLTSRELLLRRVSSACLKQLSQREAKEIHKHTKLLFLHDSLKEFAEFQNVEGKIIRVH
jgi:hypothetical protein